jgi:hypothetical protein
MKRYNYYDSEAGQQSITTESLSELIAYIENFPVKGASTGIIKGGDLPILEYISNEDGSISFNPIN